MRIQNKKVRRVVGSVALAFSLWVAIPTVAFGAEDPAQGTANDDIENMIEVGKSLVGQTQYVYGGGHSDWEEQKSLEVPTGLDNSAYVAWVLYRGMGVDMGLAPISGDYDEYFDTVSVGSLEGVQRGDLIADDRHIEIYLGKDETGTHYSLTATNDRTNVAIVETNWGLDMGSKSVMRPKIEDAKAGKNGLTYVEDVVLDGGIGEGAIGGNLPTQESTGGGAKSEADNGGRGSVSEGSELVTGGEIASGEGKAGGSTNNGTEEGKSGEIPEDTGGNKNGVDEDLFSWLNPIVDFSGAGNTHSKSEVKEKRIDGTNKGLKGHQKSLLDSLF